MIPVRVPAYAPTYHVGGERTLDSANPMYRTLCPVCDEFLREGPVVLVYVGMMPTDQYRPRFCTGAAVVVHAVCRAPGALVGEPRFHHYLSTACWHELHDGQPDMHDACRALCKFCGTSCSCLNHPARDEANLPPSPVDQARDGFLRLLAVAERCGVDLRVEDPDLFEALRDDPAWFWARGEVQPDGEWKPNTPGAAPEGTT